MHELLPEAKLVAFLNNPANPLAETLSKEMEQASRVIRLQLHVLKASADDELDTAFATLSGLRIGGLVTATDPYFTSRAEQLAALAVRYGMPTIDQNREFAAAGGLISYGGNFRDSYHIAGIYTGRILKGERPENLPVQQVTKVEMIVNLKAAKALNVTVPLSLLGRADKVIE
jgi:putative ABC transport system substrate-binding protein